MKYLIPLLLLTATPLAAQDEQVATYVSSQHCTSYDSIVEEAAGAFGEKILFHGNVIQQHISGQYTTSPMIFSVNQESGTWTLISVFADNWACQVAGGIEFTPGSKID